MAEPNPEQVEAAIDTAAENENAMRAAWAAWQVDRMGQLLRVGLTLADVADGFDAGFAAGARHVAAQIALMMFGTAQLTAPDGPPAEGDGEAGGPPPFTGSWGPMQARPAEGGWPTT